jgi:methylglutaconyl-CoA hydratase
MTTELVRRRDDGPIVTLSLNRPEKRNALSRALVAALSDELDKIEASPDHRVVILAGEGKVFCAGMDLKEASADSADAESEARGVADVQGIAHLINQIHRLPRFTIAALQGAAVAGGAGLALACDYAVMADDAKFGYPEVLRGLVPAIVTHDLIRQVGERRARQLLLSGGLIDATTAERWGLVNQVVPAAGLRSAVMERARSQLAAAPLAVEAVKRLIDDATGRPADLRGPAAVSAAARAGDEAAEGMRAFLERRTPNWVGNSLDY